MHNQTNSWLTVEDLKRDLFGISGIPYPPDDNIVPPKIISEYRLRTSQANSNVNLDESTENVFICGRGKFVKDGVLKPGEPLIEDNSTDNSNIEKQIRQVSGLGYRNEIVEKEFEDLHSEETESTEETESISKVEGTEINNLKLVSICSIPAIIESKSGDMKQDHSED